MCQLSDGRLHLNLFIDNTFKFVLSTVLVLFKYVLQCWLVEINVLKGKECFICFPCHVKKKKKTLEGARVI